MGNPNDDEIKEAHSAFLFQIETLENEGLTAIIKNYKLLMNQLDDYNGGILNDLIDIAERTVKNRAN